MENVNFDTRNITIVLLRRAYLCTENDTHGVDFYLILIGYFDGLTASFFYFL